MKTKLNSLVLLALVGSVPSAFANGVASSADNAANGAIDYVNAKPIPLPKPNTPAPSLVDTILQSGSRSAFEGPSGVVGGNRGTGQTSTPIKVPASTSVNSSTADITPLEYGTNNHPYTTNRTDAYGDVTTKYYPFRAAGKLYFKVGTSSYVCSASLIKRGVLVTAAHCVADFGKNTWHTNFVFYPGLDNNIAYYSSATGKKAYALTSYLNGTDPCYSGAPGVVCKNDVAVILLNPQSNGSYIGTSTGWLGYSYGGYGFTSGNLALITQLGYPVALDGGKWQERTDSEGYVSTTYAGNTIIGSLQTGGSSGGPWVVNLGQPPVLATGTTRGYEAGLNTVVGTTSWGYTTTNPGPKQMGASPFLSTNIVPLVNAACAAVPAACS